MNFGEKLKHLRQQNGLTQEALADKLFVTRTAVSKWETDKGLPSIDSLKLISQLFGVSMDELIGEGDIETGRRLEEKRARVMYGIALGFIALATAFALLAYFLEQPLWSVGGAVAAAMYVLFGVLSKPRHRRFSAKKLLLPYVFSRIVVLLFVIGLILFTVLAL